jgi:hypothetical protein
VREKKAKVAAAAKKKVELIIAIQAKANAQIVTSQVAAQAVS